MTTGFLVIAVAMVLIGLAAIWTGADPATLSFGQTLMMIGSIIASSGVIVAVLALVLRRLTQISIALSPTGLPVEDATVEPEEPATAAPVASGAPAAVPAMAEPPPAPAAPVPASIPADMPLPPPPPRRVPGYLASAVSGAAGGFYGSSIKSDKPPSEPALPEMTFEPPAAKPTSNDELEAMLVEVLGTSATRQAADEAASASDPEPMDLGAPDVAPSKVEEEAEPELPSPPPEAIDAVPDATDDTPALLREGVIAGIPFRLYADGSIIAEIEGGEKGFATLKDFRDFVGG